MRTRLSQHAEFKLLELLLFFFFLQLNFRMWEGEWTASTEAKLFCSVSNGDHPSLLFFFFIHPLSKHPPPQTNLLKFAEERGAQSPPYKLRRAGAVWMCIRSPISFSLLCMFGKFCNKKLRQQRWGGEGRERDTERDWEREIERDREKMAQVARRSGCKPLVSFLTSLGFCSLFVKKALMASNHKTAVRIQWVYSTLINCVGQQGVILVSTSTMCWPLRAVMWLHQHTHTRMHTYFLKPLTQHKGVRWLYWISDPELKLTLCSCQGF